MPTLPPGPGQTRGAATNRAASAAFHPATTRVHVSPAPPPLHTMKTPTLPSNTSASPAPHANNGTPHQIQHRSSLSDIKPMSALQRKSLSDITPPTLPILNSNDSTPETDGHKINDLRVANGPAGPQGPPGSSHRHTHQATPALEPAAVNVALPNSAASNKARARPAAAHAAAEAKSRRKAARKASHRNKAKEANNNNNSPIITPSTLNSLDAKKKMSLSASTKSNNAILADSMRNAPHRRNSVSTSSTIISRNKKPSDVKVMRSVSRAFVGEINSRRASFVEGEEEKMYHTALRKEFHWTHWAAVTLVLLAIIAIESIVLYDDETTAHGWRLICVIVAMCLAAFSIVMEKFVRIGERIGSRPFVYLVHISITSTALLIAASATVGNQRLSYMSSSAPVIAQSLINGIFCRVVPFVPMVWSHVIVGVGYGALSISLRCGLEEWVHTFVDLAILLVVLAVATRESHEFMFTRHVWFSEHQQKRAMTAEQRQLKKEKAKLRGTVFEMTLQKFDIADIRDSALDLDAPIEKAMQILNGLVKSGQDDLSQHVWDKLNTVIVHLGQSGDLFRPDIAGELQQKKDKGADVDYETQRWILNLVQVEGGGDASAAEAGAIKAGLPPASPSSVMRQVDMGSILTPQAGALQEHEQVLFRQLLQSTEDWDFDVFDVVKLTRGKPLLFIGLALFQKYDLVRKFKIPLPVLRSFFQQVESGYNDMPYHNSSHAADVTRTVHYFIMKSGMRQSFSDEEVFAAVFASIIHDFDHPGRNNNFQIATSNELAIRYNDKSVLEMHHLASAFRLAREEASNIFCGCSASQYKTLRRIIIEMVLTTDLSQHFDFVGQFKQAISSDAMDQSSDKSRLMLLKMALKCADLGHAAKSLRLHTKWTLRVTEEFYRQGDDESKLGLPISPFMDRKKANLPSSQVGFMNFLVIPMYELWMKYIDPNSQLPCFAQLVANRDHWTAEQAKREALEKAGQMQAQGRG